MADKEKDKKSEKKLTKTKEISEVKKEKPKEDSYISSIHLNLPVKKVEIHPLVLLSVVDHYGRVKKASSRAVGVLLGSLCKDRTLDVANCFAGTGQEMNILVVPFEEESKDLHQPYFLDTDYLDSMYDMFRKVAGREKVVGWYHTGPKLHSNDIAINEQMKQFTSNPVLVVVDMGQKEMGTLTEVYLEVQEVHDDGTPPVKTFEHVESEILAEPSEEIGVEHLLRGIKSPTVGTLSQRFTDTLLGVRGLVGQLMKLDGYLRKVATGRLPLNNTIIHYIQAGGKVRGRAQEVINLLPDINMPEFVEANTVQTNDQMMCVFLGSLVRSVITLHNLVDNKVSLQTMNETEERKEKKEKSRKERSKHDGSAASASQ